MPDEAALDYTHRHPEWDANAQSWEIAWDVYRGGRHVTAPGRAVTEAGFWVSQGPTAAASGTGEEPSRQRSRMAYVRDAYPTYLHTHVRESKEEYLDRIERSPHIPLFRSVLDIYVHAAMRTAPDRGDTGGAPWDAYWANMDLAGTKADAFFPQALTWAGIYRKCFAITDKPRFDKAAPTRAHAAARGERAYTYLISPKDLEDWELDAFGRFIWAKVREDAPRDRFVGEKWREAKNQYRVWYRDHWELYRQADKEWAMVDSAPHPCGEVPIACLFARRSHESRRTLEADGVLSDLVDGDLSIFNQLSLLLDQIYAQCFSQLMMPMAMGERLTDLELGVKRVVGFFAENGGRPLYLAPDASILATQWNLITQMFATYRQAAGVSRGRAEFSKEERSGTTLVLESEDKNNVIVSLINGVEEFDNAIHRHVAAWENVEAPQPATYSRDVSLHSVDSQIGAAVRLAELRVPEVAMQELIGPLYTRVMRDLGQGDKAIATGIAAIQAGLEPKAAPPAFGASEPDEEGDDASA